jgi:hypothetical protein
VDIKDRNGLRSIYLYLVCLITLVMVLFAVVSLVRGAVELAYPEPGDPFVAEPAFGPDGRREQLTAAEIEQRREFYRESQRRSALLGLVGAGTTLLVAGPAYLYHWRKVQAELPMSRQPVGAADA